MSIDKAVHILHLLTLQNHFLNSNAHFLTTKLIFFKVFNSIYVKIGLSASEEVIFELIKSKCLPVMLVATGLLHGVYFCFRICLLYVRMYFFSSMLPLLGE